MAIGYGMALCTQTNPLVAVRTTAERRMLLRHRL